MRVLTLALGLLLLSAGFAAAQTPPGADEREAYRGVFAAAARGDVAEIGSLLAAGADPAERDGRGRTALHVAVYGSHEAAVRALAEGGADIRAFEGQRYDAVTIAAVADDVEMLDLVLELGGDPGAVTSPYDGTALIAAAHLGHVEVVRRLIAAGAPLDHVNNLDWTALIEAIVLGDGGDDHTEVLRLLVAAGASLDLADGQGTTPLRLAEARGYAEMVRILKQAGASR